MVKYTFSYQNPNNHYLDITMELEQPEADKTHLYLPAWRPGRYQLANFAKNIQLWKPFDENDQPLSFKKVRKDCWEIETGGIQKLKVRYNYFAFKLDGGNTFMDEDQLYINPVNCALYNPERLDEECQVHLDLPAGFEVATAMLRAG